MKRAPGILIGMLLSAALAAPARAVTVKGTLVYDKVPATPQGLDTAHPMVVPAPGTHVMLQSADGTKTLADGSTDDAGNYQLNVPAGSGRVALYALSEGLQGENIAVGPRPGQVWYMSFAPADPAKWPKQVTIPAANQLSGPFNILATLHRANRLLLQIEPGLPLADHPVAVNWNPGAAPGLFYQYSGDVITLNGKQDVDTDEFDDSVILVMYGAYLLHDFSRDDSPGGAWDFKEQLDPRLAWTSGWSVFFAQAVLGNSLYIDTKGPGGKNAYTLDLEPDQLAGDKPGYWSAFSVASALWDIYADKGSGSDHLGLGLAPIWKVLRDYYPKQIFVSLLTLADGLIRNDPTVADGVVSVLASRQIDYHPGVVPPVAVPFPRLILPGLPVTGTIDSAISKRTNLLNSADYYIVRKETDKALAIDVKITGAPEADGGTLALQVYDSNGAPLGSSISMQGMGGDSQVSMTLPAGTYVIGVMSYVQTRSGTSFGSAQYQLTADF